MSGKTLPELYAEQTEAHLEREPVMRELHMCRDELEILGSTLPGTPEHDRMRQLRTRAAELERETARHDKAVADRLRAVDHKLQMRAHYIAELKRLRAQADPGGELDRQIAELDAKRQELEAKQDELRAVQIPRQLEQLRDEFAWNDGDPVGGMAPTVWPVDTQAFRRRVSDGN